MIITPALVDALVIAATLLIALIMAIPLIERNKHK